MAEFNQWDIVKKMVKTDSKLDYIKTNEFNKLIISIPYNGTCRIKIHDEFTLPILPINIYINGTQIRELSIIIKSGKYSSKDTFIGNDLEVDDLPECQRICISLTCGYESIGLLNV